MKKILHKFTDFISFHMSIISELFHINKVKTTIIIVLSLILPLAKIAELKLTEYLTNVVVYFNLTNKAVLIDTLKVVLVYAFILLIFIVIEWVFNVFNYKYINEVITVKKDNFLKKIVAIPYEYFENATFYHKLSIANKAPNEYSTALSQIMNLITYIIHFLIYTITIIRINVLFIFLIFLTLTIYFLTSKKNQGKWEYYYDHHIVPEERRTDYFESLLFNRVNHHTIQVKRQLPYFIKKYETHADNVRKYTLKMNLLSFTSEIITAFVFIILFAFILVIVSIKIVEGTYDVGKFTLISNALFQLFRLINRLTEYIYSEKQHIKVIFTYREIMSYDSENTTNMHDNGYELLINDLSYRYQQSNAYALQNINCSFKIGEKIAIVGENGSGKTTLISLILGLLKQESGEIKNFIGNAVAIMQDFQYYQLTIKENIELGSAGKPISEEKIFEILKKVELYDYVNSLPNCIYTKLGQLEDGIELSKGQYQRLALARMLANEEAKIWILDEPTAYLDPIAEIDMYEYILSLADDKLVFFISHRLGFAKYADRIIVINNGKIEEIGTHDQLMENQYGLYKKMFQLQQQWYM